jgi:hypothetical protein
MVLSRDLTAGLLDLLLGLEAVVLVDEDIAKMESRTTPIQEGEDDEDIATLDTPTLWSSQVAIRPQLSCHVTLGFSRHIITVSVITLSYDIKTGCSWMRWKGDDDAIVLDLVLAPEGLWIILCDHGKVLRHLFGST